jgi:hypothetical protein
MKKNTLLGIVGAVALVSFVSCNPDRLNIDQKGVVPYENYYKTDEDAKSALTAVYAESRGINLSKVLDIQVYNPAFHFVHPAQIVRVQILVHRLRHTAHQHIQPEIAHRFAQCLLQW